MKAVSPESSDSSLSTSSSDSDDSSSDSKSGSKSKKEKKKRKMIQASGKVKFPIESPHAHLQCEHVNKPVKFQELNFKLLHVHVVAGELEILSGEDLSTEERQGRLRLLTKIFMSLKVLRHIMLHGLGT